MPNQQAPLHLQPEVSRQLMVFLLATHLLTGTVVILMPAMSWWEKLLLLLAVLFSTVYLWRWHVSRSLLKSVVDVRFYTVDNCLVRTNGGTVFAVLDDSSFLHPWLCVLNLRTRSGKSFTLLLPNDSVSADLLRQLRVRVKFSSTNTEKNNPPRRKGEGEQGLK